MKEIIQQLLEVEREAKGIVAAAEKAARRTLADARREAQDLLEAKRQLADDEAQRRVDEQVAQARADKAARLADAKARTRATVAIPAPPAAEAIDLIVRAVTGMEAQTGPKN